MMGVGLIFRFLCRLQQSSNAILQEIQGFSLVFTSRMRPYWRNNLYVHVLSRLYLACIFSIIFFLPLFYVFVLDLCTVIITIVNAAECDNKELIE